MHRNHGFHDPGVTIMKAKREAVRRFSRLPHKHPMSKFLLQFLLEEPDLLRRLTFVRNRDFLPDTMLISELGSPRTGFELELGAHQCEEVTIVNGRLIRHTRRDRTVCISEPLEAIRTLREFKGRLYVVFSFAGPIPDWYEEVIEPNPALPMSTLGREYLEFMVREIIQEQIDLLLLSISLRQEIESALARRDPQTFRRVVPLYKEVSSRCLWRF